MDLISIIVPIYGVEDYLDHCVASICAQTYENLEIILVDDGSKDRCPAMCDDWAKKDERIRVIHKVNGGLSDARNAGIRIASGEFISFIDSDDLVEKTFIQSMYETLKKTGCDVCECGVRLIGEDEQSLRIRAYPIGTDILSREDAICRLVKEEGIYQTVWNKLYKRALIEDLWFPVGKYHEDDFWTYRVFDRIKALAVINTPLYVYRQRNASIMGSGYQLKRLDTISARIGRMRFFAKDPVLGPLTKARIQFDYLYHLQCVLRFLKGKERHKAVGYLLKHIRQLKVIDYTDSGISLKYKLWFCMFRRFPLVVANIRNILKIGV